MRAEGGPCRDLRIHQTYIFPGQERLCGGVHAVLFVSGTQSGQFARLFLPHGLASRIDLTTGGLQPQER
jgi:hypothetical protein